MQGSEFQIKVWKELEGLYYGNYCTVSQLAAQMNMPDAKRIIGSAIAKNTLAIFIPDHRIISAKFSHELASDAPIHPISRKEKLLAFELNGLPRDKKA